MKVLQASLWKVDVSESANAIDFQIINFTRPEGGDNTSSISPTDNAVKLFMWKSIASIMLYGMSFKMTFLIYFL